ncbi:DNA-binding protein [Methylobacterium organophilum]|uniref:thermonuclease family protein n=1 Tax=Methylobacterium organophilum TaxID=410 RepID=UPI001F13784E|nr:DNA-binding protein [Methylobacterium organophilum]UMY15744.1 DNA-binding protein [Methylobacterium organophilum]
MSSGVRALFGILLATSPAAQAAESCRSGIARTERLQGLGPRGELVLADGGRIVLSGIGWPEDEATAAEAGAWLSGHRGSLLRLTPRGEADRWGRIPADAVTEGEEPVDLGAGLVASGLAYADAGEVDRLCRPALLALEEAPRKAGLGVWREGVFDAARAEELGTRPGRFVVAAGRVRSVGERRSRTYLNFSARGEAGLSVTVTKRTWRSMRERGLSAETLKGRFVRVRGMLEIWRGPILDIASADMIEVLEGDRAPRR